ncbi:MAG: glycerophosphodiester phosphodiesterase family protein, partial [Anaerolineae bacterium]
VHHMGALDGIAAPPNSLEAIQASLDAGAAFIEVDITALAEDDYLLVHDSELESETSGQGPVAAATPAHTRDLRIKRRGVVTPHPVPRLSEVVRLFQQSSGPTRLQLDFKNVYPLPDDEPLERLVRLVEPLGPRVIVSTGADWQLRKLRKLAPWLLLGFDIMFYIGWGPEGEQRDPRELPRQRGAYGYYDDHPLGQSRIWPVSDYLRDRGEALTKLVPDASVFYLDYRLIIQSLADGFNWAEVCHQHGIKLDAWTMDVTNPIVVAQAPRLLQAGVDLFTTNTPRALAKLLGIGD